MKRLLLGLICGVLIAAPVGYGASRLVSNPMTAELDAGGYRITNLAGITAFGNLDTSGYVNAQSVVVNGGSVILEPPGVSVITILSGTADPSLTPTPANLGSLYVGTSALWRKSGTGDTDWTRLSP